ncbi:MAG: sensor domain-containing protein, partial [Jiangellaceae bacterium]
MSNVQTLSGAAQPERLGFIRQMGVDTGYLLLEFLLAVVNFSVLVAGLSAGLSTLVFVVGLPILAGTLVVARFLADIERLRITAVLRRPLIRPMYRPVPRGARFWTKLITPVTQGQCWLDLAHGILRFPIAVATFSIVVSWWAVAIAGTLTVAWDWSIPRGPDNTSLAQLIGLGDSTFARIGFQTVVGLVCLLTLPLVVRGCALMSAGFSRALLTGVAEMHQTISALTEQRAAAASAEATALRRLERDIHDGPQQRLVRLAMDLGRARQQVDSHPEA